MLDKLRNSQPLSMEAVAASANDAAHHSCYLRNMPDHVVKIHAKRQPRRPHHISAWAEKFGFSQADIAREIEVDKSMVSRWFDGATPSAPSQEKLAALFPTDREGICRPPDDVWLTQFFQD